MSLNSAAKIIQAQNNTVNEVTNNTNPNNSNQQTESQLSHQENIVLLGDSILDNENYVKRSEESVIEQLQRKLTLLNSIATNCAIDGAITDHMIRDQIHTIPNNATVIVISSGGNDGLTALYDLSSNTKYLYPWNFLRLLYDTRQDFKKSYSNALEMIRERYPFAKIICCTIYYPVFYGDTFVDGLIQAVSNLGVNIMSNVVIKCALGYGDVAVVDLRHIFDKKEDYANSIEPGVPGGDKITNNIIHIVQNHRFEQRYYKQRDIVYKLNTYSEDMDPYRYSTAYWRSDDDEIQQGSHATVFFRRAFNERQNRNIKFYVKFGVFSMIGVSAAYLYWKYNMRIKKMW